MSSAPTMTDWVVYYNNHIAGTASAMAARADVYAAYYVLEGQLVEFKDSGHQVVFALRAGVVITIRRANAAQRDEVRA